MAKCLTVHDPITYKRVTELARQLHTNPTRVATILLKEAAARAKINTQTIVRDTLVIG